MPSGTDTHCPLVTAPSPAGVTSRVPACRFGCLKRIESKNSGLLKRAAGDLAPDKQMLRKAAEIGCQSLPPLSVCGLTFARARLATETDPCVHLYYAAEDSHGDQ